MKAIERKKKYIYYIYNKPINKILINQNNILKINII